MEVNFLKKKYQEKWENAYLTVKGSPTSGALSRHRPPAYKVMYLQTKPNEEIKTLDFLRWRKGKLHLSRWSESFMLKWIFVNVPTQMYIKNFEKKYQEKWENAYLRVKNARASRALRRALDPGQYWLTSLARLRFAMSAKSREKFLVTKSWIRYCHSKITGNADSWLHWALFGCSGIVRESGQRKLACGFWIDAIEFDSSFCNHYNVGNCNRLLLLFTHIALNQNIHNFRSNVQR